MNMNSCKDCKRPGNFTCFCAKVILCSSCIGGHLREEPVLQHKPVPLESQLLTSLLTESWPQLQESEAVILSRTKTKLHMRQAIENRIIGEIQELSNFESMGLRFVEQLVKATVKEIEKTLEMLQAIVKSNCKQARLELEQALDAFRIEDYSNKIASRLLSCSSLQDLEELHLIHKEMDFSEINLKDITRDAFTFEVYLPFKKTARRKKTLSKSRLIAPGTSRRDNLSVDFSQKTSRISRLAQPKKHKNPFIYHFDYPRGTLYTFNCVSGDLRTNSMPKQEIGTKGSVFTPINGSIMITGGSLNLAKNTVWVYDPSSSEFYICPSMKLPRFYHAAVTLGEYLYVIGGFNKMPIGDCERYSMTQRKWIKIQSLKIPRHQHSAVSYKGRIFVAGGIKQNSIEVYNAINNTFSLLNITLPVPDSIISFVNEDFIILLAKDKVLAFDPQHSKLKEIAQTESLSWWSQSPAVLYGKHSYFVKDEAVYKVNMDHASVSKFKNLL